MEYFTECNYHTNYFSAAVRSSNTYQEN